MWEEEDVIFFSLYGVHSALSAADRGLVEVQNKGKGRFCDTSHVNQYEKHQKHSEDGFRDHMEYGRYRYRGDYGDRYMDNYRDEA